MDTTLDRILKRLDRKLLEHGRRMDIAWAKYEKSPSFEEGERWNIETGRVQGLKLAKGIVEDVMRHADHQPAENPNRQPKK